MNELPLRWAFESVVRARARLSYSYSDLDWILDWILAVSHRESPWTTVKYHFRLAQETLTSWFVFFDTCPSLEGKNRVLLQHHREECYHCVPKLQGPFEYLVPELRSFLEIRILSAIPDPRCLFRNHQHKSVDTSIIEIENLKAR
nr:MAG TPA: hypothetical protein [Caudoviricetes sp.]DAU40157.1 MAG TPA: hypothetical protein [Caudoviricetes sp.]